MTLVHRRAGVASVTSFKILILTAVSFALFGCATVTPPPESKLPAPVWEAGKLIESITQRDRQFRSQQSTINSVKVRARESFRSLRSQPSTVFPSSSFLLLT